MSQTRASVTTNCPSICLRLSLPALSIVMICILLACSAGQLPAAQDPQAAGEGTVTAWAKQGTVFPELATPETAPSTAVAAAPAGQTPASVQPSPSALPASATEITTSSTQPATPRPTDPRVAPTSRPQASQESVGRIVITTLGIDEAVVEVSWHLDQVEGQVVAIWDTVSDAAGHHRGTAAPGEQGNCVISGHSRAEDGGVFNELGNLQPGDVIELADVQGEEYEYVVQRVEQFQELGQPVAQRLANAAWMAPTQDPTLTLVTCWPDWAYTHRVVVVATLR